MQCRVCEEEATPFLDLGKSPMPNNFLKKEHLAETEEVFPLAAAFCNKCKLVQLTHVVDPEKMFRNYVYVTSTTKTFQAHFGKMAEDISKEFDLGESSVVVDIGSNDGLLLKGFQKCGAKVMGIEPATNIARMANEAGVDTLNDFFSEETVKKIIEKKGKADIITATNVFAHIPTVNDVVENVKKLMKDTGSFITESQYVLDTIETMTFDNIYHEHLHYYSVLSISNLFKQHGMEVFKVEHVDTHGGSIRVYAQLENGKYDIDPSVEKYLENEKEKGLDKREVYDEFAKKVYAIKEKFVSYLDDLNSQGKKIAGYGAPAKATTLLNFCGVTPQQISYIVDDNPLKEGLYQPGTHIPVVNSSQLDKEKPDYIIILAWNFSKEILEKTKKYSEQGIKFIVPLPEPKIIE